jgi:hypothetical protein
MTDDDDDDDDDDDHDNHSDDDDDGGGGGGADDDDDDDDDDNRNDTDDGTCTAPHQSGTAVATSRHIHSTAAETSGNSKGKNKTTHQHRSKWVALRRAPRPVPS